MSKYLLNVTEFYRVDTEDEAADLIQKAKENNQWILAKYTSQYKEKKTKGEVTDAWYKVSLTKEFTSEKEPNGNVEINYQTEGSFNNYE